MKRIVLFTLLSAFALTAFSQTTVTTKTKRFVFLGSCEERVTTITKVDTVFMLVDSAKIISMAPKADPVIIKIPCDTIKPPVVVDPPKDTLYRGLYLNGFYNIVGNKMYEDALIFDLQRWKITATHAYNLSEVLRDKSPQLAALNKRIRKETSVTQIMAARGNSSSCTGAATVFNKAYPDSSDFDGWNLEYEAYNAYPMTTAPFFTFDKTKASGTSSTEASRGLAWTINKQYLQEMKVGKAAGQVDYSVQYWGWYKTPMDVDAPKAIVELTDYAIVHVYRPAPEFGYSKDRCDALNTQAKLAGKIVTVKPLFSTEPDFMQKWLLIPGNTMDKAFFIWYKGFQDQKYTNLKSDGYIDFALDFRRIAEPSNPQARMVDSLGVQLMPDFADPDFENKTTESHLLDAQQQ